MAASRTEAQATRTTVLDGPVRPGALTALLAELARGPAGAGWDLPAVPGVTMGRFAIVRVVGGGGFGVVYEARDGELGRSVAFKAVRATGDPAREQRALAEAEAAARLAHPNIVHLYDVGRCERGPYLILELLRGETLDERLGRGPLPVREAVRVAVEIARGLAHAHSQGVVHRDLKPGNVFVCEDGQVKVLDFGLAHVFGKGGLSGGTPAYMAPEQAAGESGDERSDVYALGVLVHELLTGRLPFEGKEAGLAEGEKAPALRGTPAALGKLVGRMLARDPAGRPASGAEVLAQLVSVQRSLEPKKFLWAAWIVAAAAFLGAIGVWVSRMPLPPGRLLVAIADAENTTGQPELDAASTLLGTALEQSRRLSIVGRARLAAILRRAGGPAPERIDEAAARGAATTTGAHALIVPAIRRTGAGFEVEARAIDLTRNEPLFAVRESVASQGGIPAALDRVSERIRSEMDEEPRQAPERRVLVAQVVPANPEALRAYAEGKRLESEAREVEALEAYERAVAADPEFALAHAELARRKVWMDDASAERHLDTALRGADRLPPKEALLLEAMRAKFRFRVEEALAKWDLAIASWPQDPVAYTQAGFTLLTFYGDRAAARPYLENALELAGLDPSRAVDALVALARLDEALAVARRWEEESRSAIATAHVSLVHRLRGERREAMEAARRFASKETGYLPGNRQPGKRRAANLFWTHVDADALEEIDEAYARRGLRSWELLALRGRLREAIRTLDEDSESGMGAARRPGTTPIVRAWFHNLRGPLVWGLQDRDGLWNEVEEQLRAGSGAAMCSSHLLASLGDLDRAARLYGIWAGLADPRTYCPRLYRHVRDWQEGRAEDAAGGLAGMYGPEPAYWLGVVLGELGRDRQAVEAFRRFRRDPAWNADEFSLVAYPRSLYFEAVSLERLGDRDEARHAIERLLRIWDRPDLDLPYLREAKALRARLAAGAR